MTETEQSEPVVAPRAELWQEDKPAPRPVCAAWVACAGTFDRLGRTLMPLAIGLLGERVHLLAICPTGTDERQLPSPPIGIEPYLRGRWYAPWNPASDPLAQRAREEGCEVLHALDGSAAPLTARIAADAALPYVVSAYSLDDARRLRKLAPAPAAVLAASDPIAEALRERSHLPPERIHVLRPGVHQVRHATCFTNPQQSLSLITCGPLDAYAPYAAVLQAFAALKANREDSVLFLLGVGRAEKRLRALTERLGVRGDVTFAAPLPAQQLPGIFKAADVYLSVRARRELDVSSLLAMAAGVPVLGASGGAADFLQEGETARLFRPGDERDLSEKLQALALDRPAARDLAENALTYLREHHSPARMVAELAGVYRRVAEG